MIQTYKGIDYIIFKNDRDGIISSYCAYIKIPEDHPWFQIDDYDDLPLVVHGGFTFLEMLTTGGEARGFTPGKWAGWDYLHYGDAMYPEGDEPVSAELKKMREDSGLFQNRPGDHRWTHDEVEVEVKEAIEEMLKA